MGLRASFLAALLVPAVAWLPAAARADVTIGAVLSLTGPAASIGIPGRNVIDMLPREANGQKIRYVILDDGSDSTNAVKAFQKLVGEEKVDLVFGPSVTPTSLAVLDVAGATSTPFISHAGSESIIQPPEGNRRWAFKLVVSEAMMVAPPLKWLKAQGGNTLAGIAMATAFGDAFTGAAKADAAARGIAWLGEEKYNPADTSVTPQALKTMTKQPDAVFIAASGTPGALPVIELRARGYKGPILHNQGIANPDFLRIAGKSADGMLVAVNPVMVAEQLPDNGEITKSAMDYVRAYEGKYGPNTRSIFGAIAWDAYLLFAEALPVALKSAQPGTAEFRKALRDAMEQVKELKGAGGVFSLTPSNHNGADERALVLTTVQDGAWKVLK